MEKNKNVYIPQKDEGLIDGEPGYSLYQTAKVCSICGKYETGLTVEVYGGRGEVHIGFDCFEQSNSKKRSRGKTSYLECLKTMEEKGVSVPLSTWVKAIEEENNNVLIMF